MSNDPRYPIGKYAPQPYSDAQKEEWLRDLQSLPDELERAVQNLDAHQLDTPYREGGWTVKQVVHHVADSHMNAYIRFKLAVTADKPTINAYDENQWAKMADVEAVPINVSVTLLHALHRRWHAAIKDFGAEQWDRTVIHSEHKREMSVWFLLGLYAWHGKHHVAHITSLRQAKN